jgi:arsenate reductase
MSETGAPAINLTVEQRLQIRQGAERLKRHFDGVRNAETIERFMTDSLDRLMEKARIPTWLPVLAERFAKKRLRPLVRLEAGAELTTHPRCSSSACTTPAAPRSPPAGCGRGHGRGGVDICGELPKPRADEIVRAANVLVTMGCGDACPVYPGKRYVDWDEDPDGKSVEEIRPIRDEIGRRVRGLMAELGAEPAAA